MKNFIIAAVTGLASLTANAQVSENRKTSKFTTLEAKNGIEVIYTQEDSPILKAEADNAAGLANIKTEIRGKKLMIYMENSNNETTHNPGNIARVYVSQNNVSAFIAESGAVIKARNTVTGNDIKVMLSSGALFTGNIKANEKCSLKAKSGSNFTGHIIADSFTADLLTGAYALITGYSKKAEIASNSGATCSAKKFTAETASINAKQTSSVFITIKDTVTAAADNSASITYYGSPETVNISKTSYAIKRN